MTDGSGEGSRMVGQEVREKKEERKKRKRKREKKKTRERKSGKKWKADALRAAAIKWKILGPFWAMWQANFF